LARRLNDAHERLQRANDRLWWRLHPDDMAAIYGEHPAAVDAAFAENRSEVLGAPDPLQEVRRVHWRICQTIAELRQQLAAEAGELMCAFVITLVAAGWSEHDARTTNVRDLPPHRNGHEPCSMLTTPDRADHGVPLGCSPHEHAFGDDAPGRALVLQYVERLPEPITFCASQGSFDAPDELLRSTFRHGTLQ
jgi:hypothetical protein